MRHPQEPEVPQGGRWLYYLFVVLFVLWFLNGKIVYSQTRVTWPQIRTCKNWDQPGTRPLLRDVAALSADGPDLTIRIPGYAPMVVRITVAGTDEGNAHSTSTMSIELVDSTRAQARMGSGAQVIAISGPITILPVRTNGWWRECDSGYYALYPSNGPLTEEKWDPYPSLLVHACGFHWRLNGSRPAQIQACWHGTPVRIPEPVIFTFVSEVYKNSTSTVPCAWNSVCPAQ